MSPKTFARSLALVIIGGSIAGCVPARWMAAESTVVDVQGSDFSVSWSRVSDKEMDFRSLRYAPPVFAEEEVAEKLLVMQAANIVARRKCAGGEVKAISDAATGLMWTIRMRCETGFTS